MSDNTDRLIDEIKMVLDIGEINDILKGHFEPLPVEMDDEAMWMVYERLDMPLPEYKHSMWERAGKRVKKLQERVMFLNSVMITARQVLKETLK